MKGGNFAEHIFVKCPLKKRKKFDSQNGIRQALKISILNIAGKFSDIVGQDPSDSRSNRLHVVIFWFCFHSLDSSKMISEFPEVFNFNWLFLILNRFICN